MAAAPPEIGAVPSLERGPPRARSLPRTSWSAPCARYVERGSLSSSPPSEPPYRCHGDPSNWAWLPDHPSSCHPFPSPTYLAEVCGSKPRELCSSTRGPTKWCRGTLLDLQVAFPQHEVLIEALGFLSLLPQQPRELGVPCQGGGPRLSQLGLLTAGFGGWVTRPGRRSRHTAQATARAEASPPWSRRQRTAELF